MKFVVLLLAVQLEGRDEELVHPRRVEEKPCFASGCPSPFFACRIVFGTCSSSL